MPSFCSPSLRRNFGLRYLKAKFSSAFAPRSQRMVVIAAYLQARQGGHASFYLTRLGRAASEPPGDPRAASLLDIRRRLDALRRCRARQASIARSNALLFACLLRHGAPDPYQTIVLRWFVRHARLTATRHSPSPRARRGLRLSGVLAVSHLAPRTAVWWLDHREVVAFKRVLRCCLALDRSVRRLAASKFG